MGWEEVQHCKVEVRAAAVRPLPRNKNGAIVNKYPLPAHHQVNFRIIYEVIHEFLEDHLHLVEIPDIQPCMCALGQAYVRFEYIHDRDDNLVYHSRYPYEDVSFCLLLSIIKKVRTRKLSISIENVGCSGLFSP
jgi:hypothetical protein